MGNYYLIDTLESERQSIVIADSIIDAINKIGESEIQSISEIECNAHIGDGLVSMFNVYYEEVISHEGEEIIQGISECIIGNDIKIIAETYKDKSVKGIDRSADKYLLIK